MKNYEQPDKSNVEKMIDEHMGGINNELLINMNDYLAILTLLSSYKLDGTPQDKSKIAEYVDAINIYGYLRDKYDAKNGYEALNLLREGKIDKKVVELWVEEGMDEAEIIKDAINTGYPYIKEEIRKES